MHNIQSIYNYIDTKDRRIDVLEASIHNSDGKFSLLIQDEETQCSIGELPFAKGKSKDTLISEILKNINININKKKEKEELKKMKEKWRKSNNSSEREC